MPAVPALKVSTVLGYLAESAAAAGASATGCPLQQLQRLQQEACLAGAAADMQLWRIAAVLHSKHSAGLSAVKSALPADVSYGEIKVGRGRGACRSSMTPTPPL